MNLYNCLHKKRLLPQEFYQSYAKFPHLIYSSIYIIRNKILDNFQKEIPYSVNIQVEEFFEDNGLIRIRANIYVLRDSQRAILIGHKGSKLRKIGTQSRVEIEKLFNKKVFLETPIKISKNWRDDEKKLKKFGYQ